MIGLQHGQAALLEDVPLRLQQDALGADGLEEASGADRQQKARPPLKGIRLRRSDTRHGSEDIGCLAPPSCPTIGLGLLRRGWCRAALHHPAEVPSDLLSLRTERIVAHELLDLLSGVLAEGDIASGPGGPE